MSETPTKSEKVINSKGINISHLYHTVAGKYSVQFNETVLVSWQIYCKTLKSLCVEEWRGEKACVCV